MQTRKFRQSLAASAALAFLAGGVHSARADQITDGLLYVTDYGKSDLDRYQYTFDSTTNTITSITADGIGNNTSNAFFLGGSSDPIKEGIQGTANDLIIVGGAHGSGTTTITRYGLDGTPLNSIGVNFSGINGGNVGIGNVVATSDGQYIYAPLETAGLIVKISLTTGAIVASYPFPGAHDVAIAANGDIYAANYNGNPASVIKLDANLDASSKQTLISSQPAGVNGFRPSGLTIAADGSLYVNDNVEGGASSILHYNIATGAGDVATATYDPTKSIVNSPALEFTFGSSLGPDGNIYVAALGGGGNGGFNTKSGYTDGVYEFNPTTDLVTPAIAGYTEPSGPGSLSGLSAPKYLQFDSDFIPSGDQGAVVPEPGTAGLLMAGLAGLGVLRRRRRAAG